MPPKKSTSTPKNVKKKGTSFSLKNNGFVCMMSSIMATDSPTSVHKNEFTYDAPGRSSPPPTTSYVAARHDIPLPPPLPEDSTALESKKEEKDKEKDDMDLNKSDGNAGQKGESESKSDKKPDSKEGGGGGTGDSGGGKDTGGDKLDDRKMNGADKLDGKWVPPEEKDDEEEEEESCIVNCLYYTLQCCECTIT